jgi:hypothetical protein
MIEAARNPATAQMMIFWKNVACTGILTAVKVPECAIFTERLVFPLSPLMSRVRAARPDSQAETVQRVFCRQMLQNTTLMSGQSGTGVADSTLMSEPVKLHPNISDAEQLTRMLELELLQKRTNWKQVTQRNKSLRSAAFLFLFLIITGCLLGFFFAYTRVSQQRAEPPPSVSGH